MGRIRVLGDQLIDRIAAGEVVERPSSVVKELVENALDAGARTVEVRLASGGKRSIRVSDDGSGMDRDDALLALERHATSKLSGAEDLDRIATLGFRGEALSSIAAVSVLKLETSTADGSGTEVQVRGGRIQQVKEIARRRGTTLQVDRLFFNVPARRKFLRADSTELSHALRWLTRYALAHPDTRFNVDHGERRLLQATPTGEPLERIAQLFGRELTDKLLPFDRTAEGVRVSGFSGRPVEALPNRDQQHLFVNGRAVQDRMLAHAIHAAYGNTTPRGRHPALFLFVEIDPADVDVNVHPQKTEVRFRHPSAVHDHVRDAIQSSLADPRVVPTHGDLRPTAAPAEGIADAALRYLEVREPAARFEASPAEISEAPTAIPHGDGAPEVGPGPVDPSAGDLPPAQPPAPLDFAGREPESLPEPRAIPLAQFRDSYIVAQDAEGLVLVDQHAAHERVLFERYLEDARGNRVEVQRLLFPVTVELAPHELALLEREAGEFRRLGFDVEPFGGQTVRIAGVPALAGDIDAAGLLRELLGEAQSARSAAADVDALRRRLVTSAACQAAIKINHPLTRPAMQGLLDDLYQTDNPSSCPHGRPALFRLTLDEIERTFRRR